MTQQAATQTSGSGQQLLDVLGSLWRLSHEAPTVEEFLREFLPRSVDILGAIAGTIWLVEGEQIKLTHKVDKTGTFLNEPGGWQAQVLIQQVQQCYATRAANVQPLQDPTMPMVPGGSPLSFCVPLIIDENPIGVMEALKPPSGPEALRSESYLLQSLAGYFQLFASNTRLRQSNQDRDRLVALLETGKTVFQHLDLEELGFTIVNQARQIASCDRCSLALLRGERFRMHAVSGHDVWDRHSLMNKRLTNAIERIADADQKIYVADRDPAGLRTSEDVVHTLREYLDEAKQTHSLAIFPLKFGEELVGGWAFEDAKPMAFTPEDLGLLSVLGDLVGTAIHNAREHSTLPLVRLSKSVLGAKEKLFGKGQLREKLIPLAAIVAVLAMFLPWNYRVSGKCTIGAVQKRVCAARVEGILGEANFREGDIVSAGQVLARLDASDFKQDLRKAQKNLDETEIRIAMKRGEGKTAERRMWQAEAEKIKVEIDHLKKKISLAVIRSPVNGIIVSRDIQSAVGNPVQKGQVLCEVAPLDSVRLEVAVPEEKIGDIRIGAKGVFALNAFAEQEFAFKVENIRQTSEVVKGDNVFVVTGVIPNPDEKFRLGMEGAAKIDSGRKALGHVLFDDLANYLRMKLWF